MRPFQKLAREEALDRYRLLARLGQGGMADVFLARLVGAGGFEKLVAVKCMLSNISDDRRFVEMFLNEGRIAAQLDHPNVCHVYELGEVDGTLFLAMEFLRGMPWSEIVPAIPDRPRATLARFVTGVIAQACEGLHHAHTVVGVDGQPRSIIHRDVSPTNLFVTNEGIVKLLDFGVSKVLTDSGMTATGMLKGKLPYMSPEQLRSMPVDARTDIFSLAVVTWEALAGRALFERATAYDTMMAAAEAEIPALPGNDLVTKRLDAVLRRGLARDRTHRHASAREFADDLRQAIAPHGAPMMASEIQTHVSTWFGPILLRRSCELSALLGSGQQRKDSIGERTTLHKPTSVAGVRLRDASVAVGRGVLNVTPAIDGMPPGAADTIPDLTLGSTTDAPDVAMIALSGELTVPRLATAVTGSVPGFAVSEPTTEPTQRRAATPREIAPIGRPEWVPTVVTLDPPSGSQRSLSGMLVIAIAAIVAGMIAGLLLS